MTKEEEKEVIRVCGPNYEKSDIPAFIRNRDKKLSVCCNAPLIDDAQCENCGADGREFEDEDRALSSQEDQYHQEEMKKGYEEQDYLGGGIYD